MWSWHPFTLQLFTAVFTEQWMFYIGGALCLIKLWFSTFTLCTLTIQCFAFHLPVSFIKNKMNESLRGLKRGPFCAIYLFVCWSVCCWWVTHICTVCITLMHKKIGEDYNYCQVCVMSNPSTDGAVVTTCCILFLFHSSTTMLVFSCTTFLSFLLFLGALCNEEQRSEQHDRCWHSWSADTVAGTWSLQELWKRRYHSCRAVVKVEAARKIFKPAVPASS